MSHEPKRPVTLEDLLRLKRAERPAPEFWERFDRELRAKQLSALVKERPWWQTLPRVFSTWRRYHLPLGATAVLALTFVSLREYSGMSVRPAGVPSHQAEAPSPATAENAGAAAFGQLSDSHLAATIDPLDSAGKSADAGLADTGGNAGANLAGGPGSPVPANTLRVDGIASDRALMANFTAAHSSGALMGRGLLSGATVESPPSTLRSAAIEPLSQITSPGEVRRARILSAVTLAAAGDTLTRTGERVARNLSDDRMNDSIRRFNAKGDRLSMKW